MYKFILICNWIQETIKSKTSRTGESRTYLKQSTEERVVFEKGKLGVKGVQLIKNKNILLPPLHIKFGIFTQFICSLKVDGEPVKLVYSRALRYENCLTVKNQKEKAAWLFLKAVCEIFLGNYKLQNYKKLIDNLIVA